MPETRTSWPPPCELALKTASASVPTLDFPICKASDGAGCGEKELGFIAKYKEADLASTKAQLERLQGMTGSAMKPELQKWLGQRISILKQLAAAKDEL